MEFFHSLQPVWNPLSPALQQNKRMKSDGPVGEAAFKKIAALEEELTFLRTQIAAIVGRREPRTSAHAGELHAGFWFSPTRRCPITV